MATSINTLKSWFTTGKFPTQAQFWAWLDSYRHKDETIPVNEIDGLNQLLNLKADAELLANKADLVGGKVPLAQLPNSITGTQYTYVAGKGTPTENALELQTAYNAAKTIVGLSATNRFKIIVGTGKYEVTGQFLIDTQFIDIVSLTSDADVELVKGINVTANDVYLKGLKTEVAFQLSDNLNLLICTNCVGGNYSFGESNTASGTFTNCTGGIASFGGNNGNASGIFTNCKGADYSFAGFGGVASGIFNSCIGTDICFGSFGIASGTFYDCISGTYSFAGSFDTSIGTASGTFTNCIGGLASFGGEVGNLIGKLFNCKLTQGTFNTVSSGGRTYYCIDGNGNTNNQ